MMTPINTGIILAAGYSTRFNNGNKLLAFLGNKTLISYSLEIFDSSGYFSELLLVVRKGQINIFKNVVNGMNIKTPIHFIVGGKDRQESVKLALNKVRTQPELVVIHDGARPFLSVDDLSNVISAAKEIGASSLGIHPKDLIKTDSGNNIVSGTISKKRCWLVQTPQAFKWEIIYKAHFNPACVLDAEDDATLVENLGFPVKMVNGHEENIKITTQLDLEFAKFIGNKLLFKELH